MDNLTQRRIVAVRRASGKACVEEGYSSGSVVNSSG